MVGEGERQGHREKKNTVRKIHEAYKGRKWGQIGKCDARSTMSTKEDGTRSKKANRI